MPPLPGAGEAVCWNRRLAETDLTTPAGVQTAARWRTGLTRGGVGDGIERAGLGKSPGKPLDGVNLIPHLSGEDGSEPHQTLFWRKEKMAAVREGKYKLIRLDGYGFRLYNLEEDLGENKDISQTRPELLADILTSLESWERELLVPLWHESDPWQEVTFEIHKALMENREVTIKSPADLKKLEQ